RDRRLARLGLAARFEIDRLRETPHLPRAVLRIDQRGVVRLTSAEQRLLRDGRLPSVGVAYDRDHHSVARGRRGRVQGEFKGQRRCRAITEGRGGEAGRAFRVAGPHGAHRVAGVEFGVARTLDLVRPPLQQVRSSAASAAAVTSVDDRIALAASVDVREWLGWNLEGRLRLDLVERGMAAGVADEQARLDERQRRPVRVHSLAPAGERDRLADRIALLEESVAVVDARELDGLLFGLGRDREEHADGEAPRSDDRSGPSYTRATHTPSTRLSRLPTRGP